MKYIKMMIIVSTIMFNVQLPYTWGKFLCMWKVVITIITLSSLVISDLSWFFIVAWTLQKMFVMQWLFFSSYGRMVPLVPFKVWRQGHFCSAQMVFSLIMFIWWVVYISFTLCNPGSIPAICSFLRRVYNLFCLLRLLPVCVYRAIQYQ
jgi:hypothetical protein